MNSMAKYQEVHYDDVINVRPGVGSAFEAEGRPRQNVIFEMGYLMGRLTRSRLCILQKGQVEIPSDINGIDSIKYADRVQDKVLQIMDELHSAGYEIKYGKIDNK